jgi:hypothetical protein
MPSRRKLRGSADLSRIWSAALPDPFAAHAQTDCRPLGNQLFHARLAEGEAAGNRSKRLNKNAVGLALVGHEESRLPCGAIAVLFTLPERRVCGCSFEAEKNR